MRIACWAATVLAGVASTFLFLQWNVAPPRDTAFVGQFRTNRTTFEALRRMLLEEGGALVVAEWGVRTGDSLVLKTPPEGGLSRARYDEYMTLLKQAGGFVATRDRGPCPKTCVLLWETGFAGYTSNVSV